MNRHMNKTRPYSHRLGTDHEARHTAAEMIWLWGGELIASHERGDAGF